MSPTLRVLCGVLVAAMPAASLAAEEQSAAAAGGLEERVVIPFDFVSKFDNGRYGSMVGDLVWKKLERERCFLIPESMQDVRDFCQQQNLQIGPETDLAKVKEVVTGPFGGHVGIWGSIERVAGERFEIYDLAIKCYDFSVDPPKVIYQSDKRTESAGEISHLYVKALIDALVERTPGARRGADPFEEENWQKNKNLIVNGDFEKAAGGVPVAWEPRCGQDREPLGRLVQWLPESGNEKNHVIRLTFDKGLGDSWGVMYYSQAYPIHEGAKYRFQCRYRHTGCNVKVFIKCYDEMPSRYVAAAAEGKDGLPPNQPREVYRSQQNLKGPKGQWNTQTEDFTPKHTKFSPRALRVMLYGYLGAGTVEFDDIVIKEITPVSPGDVEKEKRHSLETKVTMKEMEENVRKSEELRKQKQAEREALRKNKEE